MSWPTTVWINTDPSSNICSKISWYSLNLYAGFEPVSWYLTCWGRVRHDDLNNIDLLWKIVFFYTSHLVLISEHMMSKLFKRIFERLWLWVLIQSLSLSGQTRSTAKQWWFHYRVVPWVVSEHEKFLHRKKELGKNT